MNEERNSIEKDLSLIIHAKLCEIDDMYEGALGADTVLSIQNDILAKAEGRKLPHDCSVYILILLHRNVPMGPFDPRTLEQCLESDGASSANR